MSKFCVWFFWLNEYKDFSEPGQSYLMAEFDNLEQAQEFCKERKYRQVNNNLFEDPNRDDCYLKIIRPNNTHRD